MQPTRKTNAVSAASILGFAAFVLVTVALATSGCAMGGQVLPAHLEDRIAKDGTADDHLAAALLYQGKADRARTEAKKYEQAAASIKPIEDPKGFRRSALMTAAQEHQKYAGEMQMLYAEHQTKADTMMGKRQPE